MSQPFSHLVTVDVEKRCLRVVRVMPNGEHVLFTELPLTPSNGQGWTEEGAHVRRRLADGFKRCRLWAGVG
jgi:hypothetical protein